MMVDPSLFCLNGNGVMLNSDSTNHTHSDIEFEGVKMTEHKFKHKFIISKNGLTVGVFYRYQIEGNFLQFPNKQEAAAFWKSQNETQ